MCRNDAEMILVNILIYNFRLFLAKSDKARVAMNSDWC